MANGFGDFLKAASPVLGGLIGSQAIGGGGGAPTALPNFITDPTFTRTQQQLEEFGGGILRGQIPEVAAPLVDPFSPQAEAVLSRALGDVSTGVQESLARSGTARSGLAPAITARAQARLSEDFRFKGLQQALQGRQNLLGQALGVQEGVAGRGLRFGEQENLFNLNRFQLAEQQRTGLEAERQEAGKLLGGALGPLIETGLPLVGGAIGGLIGGPPGALAGSSLGGALGSSFNVGGTSDLPNQLPQDQLTDLSFLQGLPRAA